MPRYDTAQAIAVRDRPENNSRNMLHKKIVQFTSAASALKSGIDVDVVQERPMTEFVTANGEMTFDPTRVAHLSSRVAGTVAHVYKTLGDDVSAGEISSAGRRGQRRTGQVAIVAHGRAVSIAQDDRRTASSCPGKRLDSCQTAARKRRFRKLQINFVSARQALANLGFDVPPEIETRDAKQLADDVRFLEFRQRWGRRSRAKHNRRIRFRCVPRSRESSCLPTWWPAKW